MPQNIIEHDKTNPSTCLVDLLIISTMALESARSIADGIFDAVVIFGDDERFRHRDVFDDIRIVQETAC